MKFFKVHLKSNGRIYGPKEREVVYCDKYLWRNPRGDRETWNTALEYLFDTKRSNESIYYKQYFESIDAFDVIEEDDTLTEICHGNRAIVWCQLDDGSYIAFRRCKKNTPMTKKLIEYGFEEIESE